MGELDRLLSESWRLIHKGAGFEVTGGAEAPPAIVRLWVLRILVRLEGLRSYINKVHYGDGGICDLFGLPRSPAEDPDTFAVDVRDEPSLPAPAAVGKVLKGILHVPEPPALRRGDYAHLERECSMLVACLGRALAEGTRGVNVLLYGPPGTGKTQLSRVVAHELGCAVHEVPVMDENGDIVEGRPRRRAGGSGTCRIPLRTLPTAAGAGRDGSSRPWRTAPCRRCGSATNHGCSVRPCCGGSR